MRSQLPRWVVLRMCSQKTQNYVRCSHCIIFILVKDSVSLCLYIVGYIVYPPPSDLHDEEGRYCEVGQCRRFWIRHWWEGCYGFSDHPKYAHFSRSFFCLYSRMQVRFLVMILMICFVSGSFAETQDRKVTFPEISTTILEKICQYFYWSLQYARLSIFRLCARFFCDN